MLKATISSILEKYYILSYTMTFNFFQFWCINEEIFQ